MEAEMDNEAVEVHAELFCFFCLCSFSLFRVLCFFLLVLLFLLLLILFILPLLLLLLLLIYIYPGPYEEGHTLSDLPCMHTCTKKSLNSSSRTLLHVTPVELG